MNELHKDLEPMLVILMQRYKLIIQYNGTRFGGWQIQPDVRRPTIQETLKVLPAYPEILFHHSVI